MEKIITKKDEFYYIKVQSVSRDIDLYVESIPVSKGFIEEMSGDLSFPVQTFTYEDGNVQIDTIIIPAQILERCIIYTSQIPEGFGLSVYKK